MSLPAGLRPGSWRGLAFVGKDTSRSGGRSVSVKPKPLSEDPPATRDLARKPRKWSVQAWLVGADAHVRKARFIETCERAGTGTLVHPTEGALVVHLEDYRCGESSDELELVRFDLDFVESAVPQAPAVAASAQAATFADAANAAFAAAFAAHLVVAGVARKVTRALTGDLQDRCNALLELSATLGADPAEVAAATAAANALFNAASLAAEDKAQLAADLEAILGAYASPSARWTQAAGLRDFYEASRDAAATGAATDDEQLILDNRAALDLYLYGVALSLAAASAAADTYTVYDDAVARRDDFVDGFDALDLGTTDADSVAAAKDLRAALVTAVTDEALDLPRLRTLVVPQPVPALVLAADLYDDATRATEIIDRNRLADPNQVSGSLLVLTR